MVRLVVRLVVLNGADIGGNLYLYSVAQYLTLKHSNTPLSAPIYRDNLSSTLPILAVSANSNDGYHYHDHRMSGQLSESWPGDRFLTEKVSRPWPSSQSQLRQGGGGDE